jgi:iron complex outermembrane receptor protein
MRDYYFIFKSTLILLMTFSITQVFAQERQISGRVTSQEEGSPLPGVNVLVKGTSSGTVTSPDGVYQINAADNAVLVFSIIGYTSQEVTVGNRSTIDVQLATDIRSLSEVVVVGYGVQEKKEITSAIASVKAEDFNKGNVNDVAQLLQGKVAGMVISKPGGNPNQGFNIRLRGLSTLGASQQPLVVIDGVIGADLNSVDPNDISSIDVLKDGAAAAIYGTRGSSGVILVTTKTGRSGRVTFDYNGYAAADKVARTVQVMNAGEYRAIGGTDLGSETDWFDEITRTGLSHVHNLALGGGTDKTTYRISLNYRDIQGIAINTGFNQLNGRVNLTQKALNDKLSFTLNLASTLRKENVGFDQAFRYASVYNPTAPVRSEDPQYKLYDGYFQQPLFDYYNPVAILEQNSQDRQIKRTNYNLQADYQIIPGLNIMARYSRNHEDENNSLYYSKRSFWVGIDQNGLAQRGDATRTNQLFETTLTYNKNFERLNLTALAGYSYQEFEDSGFGLSGGNFLTDAFGYDNVGAAQQFQSGLGGVGSYRTSYKLIAPAFGRVNLSFDDTYFFMASLRYEGSSRFGKNNRWGWFPAVSAGVNIANLIDIPVIEDLKIRASYGVTGSLPGESYISQLRYGPGSFFMVNGKYVPVYGPVSNPNPDLKWETKAEANFGIDFSILKGRITGAMDYYTRTTSDLLIELPVSVPPNLFPTSILNVGKLKNNGFELAVNFKAINKPDFSWTPGVNLTTFNTELVSLSTGNTEYGVRDIANLGSPGQNNTPLIRVEEGKPLGQIWGLVYEGINDDGKYKFKDTNEDGKIDNLDRQVIGNGYPNIELGFNNSFNYKNFDLNFFFRGAFGHNLVNTYRAFYETRFVAGNYNVVNTKHFDPNLTSAAQFSSLHVEDASFLKLDNATIGYNFDMPQSGAVSRLRLYFSGQNLFFITNYSGVDPEVRFADIPEPTTSNPWQVTNTPNPLAPGIDRRNTWYRTRTFTFGVNLTF